MKNRSSYNYNQNFVDSFKPGVIVKYIHQSRLPDHGADYDYGICLTKPFELHGLLLVRIWWFTKKPHVINKKAGDIGISQLMTWPFQTLFSPAHTNYNITKPFI